MKSLFADEHKALALSRYMLASGAALLIIGILGGYVFDSILTLPAQVFVPILAIAGPTLVKWAM